MEGGHLLLIILAARVALIDTMVPGLAAATKLRQLRWGQEGLVARVLRIAFRRCRPEVQAPRYSHEGDAGVDLVACEERVLAPGERFLFPTGVAVAIPEGYVGLVWDRSGLAARAGLTTLGGVIDANYRGEIKVALLNTGDRAYRVAVGDRIAQLLVQPVCRLVFEEQVELDETGRGELGFGSSGR